MPEVYRRSARLDNEAANSEIGAMRRTLQPREGRTFWGIQRNVWVDIHAWVAASIAAIILVHLIMNWGWFVGTARRIIINPIRVMARNRRGRL